MEKYSDLNSETESIIEEKYMREALSLAAEAFNANEVPVGCVIVRNGEIIGKGRNMTEQKKDPTLHAEIIAIREACTHIHSRYLTDCDLYVTVEPCPMCAGAIMAARLRSVIFGAFDSAMGAVGSVTDLFYEPFGFKPVVRAGILSNECSEIMSRFFENLRK